MIRVETIELQAWLGAANQFKDYNYTHYWEYARLAAERVGALSEHIAVYDGNGDLLALANVRIKRLPLGFGGIAYISGGPIVDRSQKNLEADLESVLAVIQHEYVNKRGLVLRISQRHKASSLRTQENAAYHKAGFIEHGKTNATMLIDLSPELELIRKGFHQKWRNVLNKSERQSIEVIAGGDQKLFDDFGALFEDLRARKEFDVDMDDQFYSLVQRQSPEQEQFHMAIAYVDGAPIGGHLSSMNGDTSVYLLGATNDVGRKLGAAYLLQWHVITESKLRGCHWYDLGGVDKEENPHVYLFKERMGGEETCVGSIFQAHVGMKGALTLFAEKAYRMLRKK